MYSKNVHNVPIVEEYDVAVLHSGDVLRTEDLLKEAKKEYDKTVAGQEEYGDMPLKF